MHLQLTAHPHGALLLKMCRILKVWMDLTPYGLFADNAPIGAGLKKRLFHLIECFSGFSLVSKKSLLFRPIHFLPAPNENNFPSIEHRLFLPKRF